MSAQPSPRRSSRAVLRRPGMALLAAAFPFAVAAQPEPDSDQRPSNDEPYVLADFTVTSGFASSLAAATEEKQRLTVISEVIHAEDIGKLPDISIAESLTRLPGLTTQRLNGRAQAIVIRGLNGDFSTALLNGRQQVSTASGRSVEFDQYPAELLNNVVVYKSTDASLVGQGLSGTVDLQTVRPLSFGRRAIAASVFYEWTDMAPLNPDSDRGGFRETLSYIDQFNDRKVGIAFGVSNSVRPGQGEQFNSWGYDSGFGGDSLMGGAKPFVRSSEIRRDAYMGVIEFKPNETFHSTIDLFYSNFHEDQKLRGIEMPLSPNWGTYAVLEPGYTVEDGLITDATLTNFFGVARNDYAKRDDHLFAGGWNFVIGPEEGWRLNLDLSHSRVKRTDFVLETYSGYGVNGVGTPDTITYHLAPDGGAGATFEHQLDYSDGSAMRLGMPQGWGVSDDRPSGQHGFVKGPIAEDKLTQYKASIEHPLPVFFNRFELGLVFNQREKYETESGPNGMEGFFLQLPNGASSAPMPESIGTADLSFIGMGELYAYDPVALYENGFYDKIPNNDPARMSNNWDVEEKISIAFLKLDIDHKLGRIPLTGNLGVQVIHTEQKARGQAINTGSLTVDTVTGSHDYTDFVPSLNLNFHLTDRDSLRVSAARQLARQPMNDMRAGSTFSFDRDKAGATELENSPWSAEGGNPELEPWRSNSFDVSLEHYFADSKGYVAVAAFYKDLVSYTYNAKIVKDFTGYPTGAEGVEPVLWEGYSTVPTNGQGGMIKGLEFTLSIAGEKFTPVLKGFGVIASASFFKSSIQPDLGNPATPLVGLSDQVRSGTVYYERGGFSARISARFRNEYRGDIATFGPRGAVYRNLQPETVVDAQVSYTFQRGPLKNLAIIAQAYNLTDEPLVATSGADTRYIQDYQEYGANYSLGVSYKF